MFVVLYSWHNGALYEDYDGNYKEFVGVFDTLDRAISAVDELKHDAEKAHGVRIDYDVKSKDNTRFEWCEPAYFGKYVYVDIREIEMNKCY